MEISLRLEKVRKSFADKLLFSDLSYTFYKRNYHLVGKNGVGKSTLLRLMVGLDSIDSGSILLNGRYPVAERSINAKKIFYIPDDVPIYPFLTGHEFLSWIAKLRLSTAKEIHRVMERLELIANQNSYIADMSFGTKKKFLLASILLGHADFIILDEPLNGLDKNSQQVLLEMLREKAEYSGIILTTHHEANIDLLHPITVGIVENSLVESIKW